MKISSAFESESIAEAARSFAALSKRQRVDQVAKAASRFVPHSESFGVEEFGADEVVIDFLEAGLFEELMALSSERIKQVESVWDRGPGPKEAMIVVSLSPEHAPFSFAPTTDIPFESFDETLHWMAKSMLKDDDLELVESLYRHVAKYAAIDSRGRYTYEMYFSFVVLALKIIHGRDRVISMLDRVTAQQPVTSLEFIQLLESDVNLDEIPISWALHF